MIVAAASHAASTDGMVLKGGRKVNNRASTNQLVRVMAMGVSQRRHAMAQLHRKRYFRDFGEPL